MRISSDPLRSLGDRLSLGYVDLTSPTMLPGLNGVPFREIRVATEKVITQEDGSGGDCGPVRHPARIFTRTAVVTAASCCTDQCCSQVEYLLAGALHFNLYFPLLPSKYSEMGATKGQGRGTESQLY